MNSILTKECTIRKTIIQMKSNITSVSFSSKRKTENKKITTVNKTITTVINIFLTVLNIFFAIEKYLFLKVQALGERHLIIINKIEKINAQKNAQFNLSIFTFRKVDFRIISYQ